MTCMEWREVLSAELDGEAAPDESSRAAAHLRACAACRGFKAGIAGDRLQLRSWSDEPLPASRARAATLGGVAAAAILMIAIGFLAGRATRPEPSLAPAPRQDVGIDEPLARPAAPAAQGRAAASRLEPQGSLRFEMVGAVDPERTPMGRLP